MSTKIMLFLLAEYVILVFAAIFEKRWALAAYWAGAILIQIAVIVGMK